MNHAMDYLPTGIIVPIVTAFRKDTAFDPESQRKVVQRVLRGNPAAIFALGTTGEAPLITYPKTRRDIITIILDEVSRIDGVKPHVLAGVTDSAECSTMTAIENTVRNTEEAKQLGVDGVVIAPLSIPGLEDTRKLFDGQSGKRLLALNVPIMLYDNPEISVNRKKRMVSNEIVELSRIPSVKGIKIVGDDRTVDAVCERGSELNQDFAIYTGSTSVILLYTDEGRKNRKGYRMPAGIVTAHANVFPEFWEKLWYELANQKEPKNTQRLVEVCYIPKINAFKGAYAFQAAVKGIQGTEEKQIALIKAILEREGIISSRTVLDERKALTDMELLEGLQKYGTLKKTM